MLERRERARSRYEIVLTACPLCGQPFEPEESRVTHFLEHEPADAGLSPLGEVADGVNAPMWPGDPAPNAPDAEEGAGA